jgi:transcriptional regulator with XRE-family HTH domain
MTVNELLKIAAAAFGPDWKKPLAEALGMSREMMWRYEKEVTPISDEVSEKIRKACAKTLEKRIAYLSGVHEKLVAKLAA